MKSPISIPYWPECAKGLERAYQRTSSGEEFGLYLDLVQKLDMCGVQKDVVLRLAADVSGPRLRNLTALYNAIDRTWRPPVTTTIPERQS